MMPSVHYDMHLLLRRILTANPLGFLADIVAEARYDLACTVDVRRHFSRQLPFPRPTDRPLRWYVPALPRQERRGEVLILVNGFKKE